VRQLFVAAVLVCIGCTISACSSTNTVGSVLPDSSSRKPQFTVAPQPCAGTTCNCFDGIVCPQPGGPPPGGGGGGGSPAPTSKACPTKDKSVGTVLSNLNNTNPAIFNSTDRNEAYGYVYQNGSDFKTDGPFYTTLNEDGTTSVPGANSYTGWKAVGMWHTHPWAPTNPTQIDTRTGNHFSPSDEGVTNSPAGMEIYVGVLDTTASPLDDNPVVRWYSYTGGQSDTLMGNVGSGGC
jgi:hypothetical protein